MENNQYGNNPFDAGHSKTFAVYAGAVICFGGLIFAGIRMMSGRFQFTAAAQDLKIANRELGTVTSIGEDGRLFLRMDGGREVELDPRKHAHLDHGYAVTSHSSQGQTADRVLIHVDTELGAKDLLNNRMAYVAISRGAYDAQLFTNDSEKLGVALGRDVSHRSALSPEMQPQEEIAPKQEIEHSYGWGINM